MRKIGQFIDSDVRNSTSGIGYYLYKAGGFGMSAVVPVITAGVAYSRLVLLVVLSPVSWSDILCWRLRSM